MSAKYDQAFYDLIRPGVQASAAVVVPLVLAHLGDVRSVVDVGCGEGWWAHAFAAAGCEVLGIDGSYVDGSALPPGRYVAHDLARPLGPLGIARSDLAVCLEVAEHLPASRADTLISDLCDLADVVLFSAAIPGQGGVGHVNEQPPAYWVQRFEAMGYWASGALRWQIWDNPDVENWYKANTLVFARWPELYPALYYTPLAPPWSVVHPVLFDARRT